MSVGKFQPGKREQKSASPAKNIRSELAESFEASEPLEVVELPHA
jgi:hypothetical protein